MPISASVSSSAQSSTTTAMFLILSLNFLGRRRSARSTNASNCRRVIGQGGAPARPPDYLEPTNPLDVDDVRHVADRGHDVLQLAEVAPLDHEVVDPAAVIGHRHFPLGDVAVLTAD